MSKPVLAVESVSKRYVTYSSMAKRVLGWFDFPMKPDSEFWAVRDVSLRMNAGEAIAIIGMNGAGKSTLLKMIAGTVRPTSGTIWRSGRTSALLELGLGFNPEFTGRQNIYMSLGMMGLSTAEIDNRIVEIADFAEVGNFFDQPLRVLSSGMQARVAFAAATAVRPEVLIVDEVLAVGDSYFQHKSFARIRQFKEQGTGILFVTHGMGDVRTLCNRVILLDGGKLLREGLPDEVIEHYNAQITNKENATMTVEQRRLRDGRLYSEFGTREAVVRSIELIDRKTLAPISTAFVGQQLSIRTQVDIVVDLPRLVLGHRFTDRSGHIVWGSNTWLTKQVATGLRAGDAVTYHLDFDCDLGPGSYGVSFGLVSTQDHLENCYQKSENSLVFDVVNTERLPFIGTSALKSEFRVQFRRAQQFKRIAIASTPRCGNTWLRVMLERLYCAMPIAVHSPSDLRSAEFGDCNIILQLHWPPTPEFVSFLDREGFDVVTLARHPLDILLSILQFASSEPDTARWLDGEGGTEESIFDAEPNSKEFVAYGIGPRARALLGVTERWARQGNAIVVRYEDLVDDPTASLSALVEQLGPPMTPIESAINAGDFSELKKHSVNRHFWQGTPGLWRQLLTPTNANTMAKAHSGYMRQFGYPCPDDEVVIDASTRSVELTRRWRELACSRHSSRPGNRS